MAEGDFAKGLNKRREISITVTGRNTGRAITIPVWFVSGEDKLWLLPVNGSETQWYRNLNKNRAITIRSGSKTNDSRARLIKDPSVVSAVVEKFREKYTPREIKRWYKRLDVAVEVPFAV